MSQNAHNDPEHTVEAQHAAVSPECLDAPEVAARHAQKLEALGQLASGIAHEISTPIQFVGDSVSYLKGVLADVETFAAGVRALADEEAEELSSAELRQKLRQLLHEADADYLISRVPRAVDRVVDGLSRVATIVRAMKDFSHPHQRESALADLNEVVERALVITRGEYKHLAELRLALGPLPRVRCHAGDILQVLVNLLTNAAHAIETGACQRGARGRIEVTTELVDDGGTALVSISDDGGGIPEDVQPKVFDPFFTTKPPGKGTGQGLAISRALIEERHGGQLRFTSTPGRGTTFFIRLPTRT